MSRTPALTSAPALPGLTVVEHLGGGGFAQVWLYRQQSPRRNVAVKVLDADTVSETGTRQLMAEADAMAELSGHPSIVPVYSAGVSDDGRPYIVMQHYGRANLSVRARMERFSVADVLRIGVHMAGAVETAHRAGILHRDIKPANILTDQYGTTGLTDFGIAATQDDAEGSTDGFSAPWAPPEFIADGDAFDARSDVYALGASLWHLLVGRPPFEIPGSSNRTTDLMDRAQNMPPPRTGRPDVPESLERLLQSCLAKRPDARPQTAYALARALRAVEAEERLPLTDVVVASDRGAETLPEAGPATNVRRPRRIDAQPAARTPSRPTPVVPGPRTYDVPETPSGPRARQSLPDAPDDAGTALKPPQRIDPSPPAAAERSAPSRRRLVLAGSAVGVVAVAAVVAGLVLTGGNGESPAARPSQTLGPAASQDPLADVAPEAPTDLRGARPDANHVRFTWTDSSPQTGDTFAVTAQGAVSASRTTTTPTLMLAAPAGKPVCLSVRVDRAGGQASPAAGPVCA